MKLLARFIRLSGIAFWWHTVAAAAEPTHWAVLPMAGDVTPGDAVGPGPTARFRSIVATGLSPDRSLLILDGRALRLKRMSPDGTVTLVAGSSLQGRRDGTGPEADFWKFSGMTVAADGMTYLVDERPEETAIRRIDTAGVVSTVHRRPYTSGGAPTRFSRFIGLTAVDTNHLRTILFTWSMGGPVYQLIEFELVDGGASLVREQPLSVTASDVKMNPLGGTMLLVESQRPKLFAFDGNETIQDLGVIDERWYSKATATVQGAGICVDAAGTTYAAQSGAFNLLKRYPRGTSAEVILTPKIPLLGVSAGPPDELFATDGTRVLRITRARIQGLRAGTAKGGGVVYVEPLNNGTTRVRAEPNDGFVFMEWNGDVAGNAAVLTLPSGVDLDFQAVFGASINVQASPPESLTLTIEPQLTLYPYGTEVTITATASECFRFFMWNVANDPYPEGYPIRVHQVTEAFYFNGVGTPIPRFQVQVTVQDGLGGTAGILSDGPVPGLQNLGAFKEGTTVTLVANPAADYAFDQWVDGSRDNPRRVTVDRNLNATAVFRSTGVAPALFAKLRTVAVPLGGTIKLMAGSSGTEPLTLQWWRSGQPIRDANEATLVLPAAVASDGGAYALTASNRFGEATLSFQVDVFSQFTLKIRPDGEGVLVTVNPDIPVTFESSSDLEIWQGIGLNMAGVGPGGETQFRWAPAGKGFLRAKAPAN